MCEGRGGGEGQGGGRADNSKTKVARDVLLVRNTSSRYDLAICEVNEYIGV